jgi:predicted ester cyclase
MSEREQLVVAMFDRVINEGDLDAAEDFFAADYVDHGPMGPMQGVEQFKEIVRLWRGAVPDVRCTVENWFESGDMAGWLVRVTGTFTNEMMGIPPTGKSFEYVTANLGRVGDDGKFVEHWSDQGMFQFLTQVGAIPAPGAAA